MIDGITEQESDQIVRMYLELKNDPEKKIDFYKLLKSKWPKLNIPELVNDDRLSELTKEHKQELDELKRQMMDRDVRDRLEKERAKLRVSPFNLTEKEIEEVEKIMTDKGLPTHEVAAEWYLKVTTPARPSGFMSAVSPGAQDVQTNRDLIKNPDSALHKNPKKWAKDEFDAAWNDVFETGRVKFS